MPKVSLLQEGFNGGEFSPMAQGRVSSDRYKTGLNACLNYIPTLQGPLIRRPGTKVAAFVSNPLQPSVLIPFVFSQTQAYMLEFGQQYIKFYANGGTVVTQSSMFKVVGATNDLEHFFFGTRPQYAAKTGEAILGSSVVLPGQLQVQTPYNYQDVGQIKWAQSADTLYLTHPNYPTFKLQRFGTYDWRLAQVYFQDGPYLALNSYAQIGDSTQITLVPVGSGFTQALWANGAGQGGTQQVLVTGPQTKVVEMAGTGPGGTTGQIIVTTQFPNGYWNGMSAVVKNVFGTTEANTFSIANSSAPISWPIQIVNSTSFILLGSNVPKHLD